MRKSKLVEACVVFVDIIGFRALAKCPGGDPTEPLAALEWLDGLGGVQNPHNPHYYFRLSDSAVYVVPIIGESRETARDVAYLWARRAQGQAIDKKLLLRGGMTRGTIYCDQKSGMVFGPALHRAYSLESSRAVVPRVVIDRSRTPSKWRSSVGLVELGDGRPFIQYLGSSPLVEDGVPGVLENLKKHEAAVHRLIRTSRSPRNLAMCNYLVSFHNIMLAWLGRFVDQLPPQKSKEFRSSIERLRITGFDIVPALLIAGLTGSQ